VLIVEGNSDLLDRIAQLKELLEDRDDLRCQIFMHDRVAAVVWPSKPM
jgi:hypothetical protein